jgi:hypothetical protein
MSRAPGHTLGPMTKTTFYLGGMLDEGTRERSGDLLTMAPDELTTHGVIVGMTGSGKTGLGVIFLEEALRAGIPALILDPKGDMTNLLLTFPRLDPSDFEPWLDDAEARRQGKPMADLARETAGRWRDGLASWDLTGDDIGRLRAGCEMTIFTPGSTAGVPLDVLGSLTAPDVDWGAEGESIRDEIAGLVTGILSLVGIRADSMADREAILLSHLIESAWRDGEDLSLESLIARVDRPPMRKMGVYDIDRFFPEKDRHSLAMRLNNLVASPSFSAWRLGTPLDPAHLLHRQDGTPRAAIVYMAHLSDDERQFVVSTVLSRFVTWMRRQSGTGDLRALVYMDEMFGFVPPTANPPAKQPILTLFKEARAFGVGMLLATQNPVDLDYKAMANAGAWCVGRLQTARDKARILEALRSASGEADLATLDTTISGLTQRQFLLYRARTNTPSLFSTRWAMSYLRGPLTRDQVGILMRDVERPSDPPDVRPRAVGSDDDRATPVRPSVTSGVPVYHLRPDAPWAEQVGAIRTGTHFAAGIAARVRLAYRDQRAGVRHETEWEAVCFPLADPFDPGAAITVDHDDRDFASDAPGGATYDIPDVDLSSRSYLAGIAPALRDHLHRTESLTVFHNPDMKLYSRVDESRDEFVGRCAREARDRADAEVGKTVALFDNRIARARDRIQAAAMRLREVEIDVETRRREEMVSGAASILGALIGRRGSVAASGAARRRSMTQRAEQRAATARAKVERETSVMVELETQRDAAVSEARAAWDDKASAIDEVMIGPGKTTMKVEQVAVVWIPVA